MGCPVARVAQTRPTIFDINDNGAILVFWLHVEKMVKNVQKGMFFNDSARSPHRTAKPSRGCLPLAHLRALPAVMVSDQRSPSAMCEFPFECLGCFHSSGGGVCVRSLRNKRPDLSGRPPCKGMAIGVARRGGRLGGERTLRVPASCSFPVSHSGGPHVVSFVAGRRPCARGARVRAGVARRAAESVRASWRGEACCKEEEEKSAGQRRTKDKGPRKERKLRACRRIWECYGGSVAVRAQ